MMSVAIGVVVGAEIHKRLD